MINKNNIKNDDFFKPDDWMISKMPKEFFSKRWLKKININDPSVLKSILAAIISSVTVLGVLKRREVKKQIAVVLQHYKQRNKKILDELRKSQTDAKSTSDLVDDKRLKQVIEQDIVYSAGVVSYESHKGQRFRWLLSEAEHKDPYHRTLAGGIYPYGFKDKNGHDLGANRRWGCQCGIQWLGKVEK